ncbi:MAG: hypothetical protein E7448_03520 [Ruminococcaceae bacterium]|nr:hypothetical protein [Oscillospiraceae bacterium]
MNFHGKINWVPVIAVLAVIFVILMVIVVGLDNRNASNPGDGNQNSQPSGIEPLTVLTVTDQGDKVIVATNYCAIKYAYSMSDLVQVETINEDNKAILRFYTVLNGTKMPLYEMVFGGQEGIPLGSVTVGKHTLQVYMVIHESMPGLDDSSRIAFIAAQETINDVASSLKENSNFVPAD